MRTTARDALLHNLRQPMPRHVLALAGGVGGAKLALGLSRVLPPNELTVIVNTGDDEHFHGLHVSPDLDTVMYTLAGLANRELGWGIEGDTFAAMDRLEALGGDAWFRLGDRDLSTHLRRTELLAAGMSLSEVTAELCRRLGVGPRVAPMTDGAVRTIVETNEGTLAFQDYFVRRRCEPQVQSLHFAGAADAGPSPAFADALEQATIVIYCPSNPFVSIDPILALHGVRERLRQTRAVRVAVSPIIGGKAVKGPAAKMLAELGQESSCVAVAAHYRDLCDVFLLDEVDAALAGSVAALGMHALAVPTLMVADADKTGLARRVLDAGDAALARV